MIKYCVAFQFKNTGDIYSMRCDSALDRVLMIIGFGAYVNVVHEWEE